MAGVIDGLLDGTEGQGPTTTTAPAAPSGVTVGTVSTSGPQNNVESVVWNHTVTSGTSYLVIAIAMNQRFAPNVVTIGGSADGVAYLGADGVHYGNYRVTYYGLANPTPGVQSVSLDFTGHATYGAAVAINFSGATSANSVANEMADFSASAALTVTTAAGEMAVAGMCSVAGPDTTTSGTERGNITSDLNVTSVFATSPTGAFAWTHASSNQWQAAGIVVKP